MSVPYSGHVSVFPLNSVSFATDRSVVNPLDTTIHANAFNNDAQLVDVVEWVSGPKQVYELTQLPVREREVIQQYKLSVGPVEFAVVRNDKSNILILRAFLHVPIVGLLLIASGAGSLKDGVSISLNLGPVLKGTATVAVVGGSRAFLAYDFTDIHKDRYAGKVRVF